MSEYGTECALDAAVRKETSSRTLNSASADSASNVLSQRPHAAKREHREESGTGESNQPLESSEETFDTVVPSLGKA